MAKTKTQCPVGRAMKSAGFKTPKEVESRLQRDSRHAKRGMKRGGRVRRSHR